MTNKNLNLLSIFKTIAEEASLSKAALKLGLSQPSLSYSIKRLREDFSDELFIRLPHGISLTPKAEILLPQISDLLSKLEAVYLERPLILNEFRGRFVLGATAYFESLVIKDLYESLKLKAPLASFKTLSLTGGTPVSELINGSMDLAVASYFDELPKSFFARTVATDPYVVLVRMNHPYLKTKQTLADYLKLTHVRIALGAGEIGRVDRAIAKKKLERKLVGQIGDFLSAPVLVSQSDLALTIPLRLALLYKSMASLEFAETPIRVDPIEIKMIWHARNHKNVMQKWFREMVVKSFRHPTE